MPTVLLRLSRIDPLKRDLGLQDPDGQPGDADCTLRRSPRLAIVDADRCGHPVFTKCSDEGGPDLMRSSFAACRSRLAADQVAAERVSDGKRIASRTVPKAEPAFEIHRPDRVRFGRVAERLRARRLVTEPLARAHQSTALQQLANGARGRHIPGRLEIFEQCDELLWTPRRVVTTKLHEPLGDRDGDGAAVALRPARPILQTSRASRVELLQPLVTSLRRDTERRTQTRERRPVLASCCDEAKTFTHGVGLCPGHGPRLLPMSPV